MEASYIDKIPADHTTEEAPPPEKVIVTGWLDSLTASKRAFQLKMSNGRVLRGRLPPHDPADYAPLFARKVVVDGEARFRPSGDVALIVASHIQLARPADDVWEQVPRPRPRTLEDVLPSEPFPPGSNPIDRIWGTWPGDESMEELLDALRKMG